MRLRHLLYTLAKALDGPLPAEPIVKAYLGQLIASDAVRWAALMVWREQSSEMRAESVLNMRIQMVKSSRVFKGLDAMDTVN